MFYEKIVNNFLNSEHKIIYAEKRVNNFLNNAEQKIILCKIVEIVYAENNEQFLWENSELLLNAKSRFYECSKQIRIYSKLDVQRANFINVKIDLINTEKLIRLLWNLNIKMHSDFAFKFRKYDFTKCFMRKQGTIF